MEKVDFLHGNTRHILEMYSKQLERRLANRTRAVARNESRLEKKTWQCPNPVGNEIDRRVEWYDDGVAKYTIRQQEILQLPCSCGPELKSRQRKNTWCENCLKVIPVVKELYSKRPHAKRAYGDGSLSSVETLYYHFFPEYKPSWSYRYCDSSDELW